MTDRQTVRDEGNAYFTLVPNMLDDSDLDPYAFRLYVHYKRICGANNYRPCDEGLRQTAAACRMSKSQVARAREQLAAAGWIRAEMSGSAGKQSVNVTVVDRMLENVQRYAKPVPTRDTPVPVGDTPSPVGTEPSLSGTPPVPPGDTHKNVTHKNKEQEEQGGQCDECLRIVRPDGFGHMQVCRDYRVPPTNPRFRARSATSGADAASPQGVAHGPAAA